MKNNVIEKAGGFGGDADPAVLMSWKLTNNILYGSGNGTAIDVGSAGVQPNGQGAGTGLNVHAIPSYGDVTTDLMQAPRPTVGPWDRGAFGL